MNVNDLFVFLRLSSYTDSSCCEKTFHVSIVMMMMMILKVMLRVMLMMMMMIMMRRMFIVGIGRGVGVVGEVPACAFNVHVI